MIFGVCSTRRRRRLRPLEPVAKHVSMMSARNALCPILMKGILMNRQSLRFCIAGCTLLVLSSASNMARAEGRPSAKVNGTLAEKDGLPVLTVWGTPEERGYAHGFLLANEIVSLFDVVVGTDQFGGGADGYTKRILPMLGRMKIDPQYVAELQGMLAGIEARAQGSAQVPRLRRSLRYEDLVAVNCLADFMKTGCSSFAAWGPMTKDGATIAGRNVDYYTAQGLFGTDLVVVNTASDKRSALGWVSITWPGMVCCFTGMNAEGVTVSLHNVEGYPPSVDTGFTPRGFTFRKAIESARSETAFEDVMQVLQEHVSLVGNNVVVTKPFAGKGRGASVFEYDGDLSRNGGVTIRDFGSTQNFIACTNDYHTRAAPGSCGRYSTLSTGLQRIAASGGVHYLTKERAKKMLRDVVVPWNTTYHSVVFEPNKRLMHVGFAKAGKDAPYHEFTTLDVSELLKGGEQ